VIPGTGEEALQTATVFRDRGGFFTTVGSQERFSLQKKKNSHFGAPSAGFTSTFTHNCCPFSPTADYHINNSFHALLY